MNPMSQLEDLAKRLLETQELESARALHEALRHISDSATLRALAERFYADPEVSVPTFARLLELSPEDVVAHVQLGFVYFLMGEDGDAARQLEKARALEPEHVQVLTLEAALATEPAKKIQLYRRILQKDPRNEVARGQLRELGASS
jgi:DNA-binding SARP family transcriptional activator